MIDTHINRIMKLCDLIEDELEGAKKYIKLAIKMKGQDKTTADTFYNMSAAEISHAENLGNMATKEIQSAKDAGEDIKAVAQCVYDWEKGKHVDKMAELKNMMAMYKS